MAWAIFRDAHRNAIIDIIHSGSDRVTVIVGGSFLDESLRKTVEERFRHDTDITNKLQGERSIRQRRAQN